MINKDMVSIERDATYVFKGVLGCCVAFKKVWDYNLVSVTGKVVGKKLHKAHVNNKCGRPVRYD